MSIPAPSHHLPASSGPVTSRMAQHSWVILQLCPGVLCAQHATPRHSPGSATSRDNRTKSTAGSLRVIGAAACCGPSQATAPHWAMGCPHETLWTQTAGKGDHSPGQLQEGEPSLARQQTWGAPHCSWMLSQKRDPTAFLKLTLGLRKVDGAAGRAFLTVTSNGAARTAILAVTPDCPLHICCLSRFRGGRGIQPQLVQTQGNQLRDAQTHHETSCPRSSVTVSFLPQPEIEAEKLKVSQNT